MEEEPVSHSPNMAVFLYHALCHNVVEVYRQSAVVIYQEGRSFRGYFVYALHLKTWKKKENFKSVCHGFNGGITMHVYHG